MIMDKITPKDFKLMFVKGAEVIFNFREELNSLNVYPVPDGDTGTNMTSAIKEAVNYLNGAEDNFKDIAESIEKGSLIGARGNSGVILSQFFRGFVYLLKKTKKDYLEMNDIATCFKNAKKSSYKAIIAPVEGTILTVIRRIAEEVDSIVAKSNDLKDFFSSVSSLAFKVVEKTPDLLPKLKEAGVVDSGAKGLAYIIDGFKEYVIGNRVIDYNIFDLALPKNTEISSFKREEDIKFQYCTELMVSLHDKSNADAFKEFLQSQGDSLIFIPSEDSIRLHVHTNHPGLVIEEALNHGSLDFVKIDNMKKQHNEIIKQQLANEPPKEYAFVAVVNGDGWKEIYSNMGFDALITGGQSMNPSFGAIKEQIDSLNAKNIFVFPNNSNIILTSRQVAEKIKNKNVIIIPTKDMAQGISAFLGFDETLSLEENIQSIEGRLEETITADVTYAVRDTKMNDVSIKKGDIIAISDQGIVSVHKNLIDTVIDLVKKIFDPKRHSVIIFYRGKDTDPKNDSKIEKILLKEFEDAEIQFYNGGQEHYYYTIAIE
jgi:DAK2 domain fusion protein YloV